MVGMGYSEIQTYSFMSPKGMDNIRISDDSQERDMIRLINPLGEETSAMRTTLIPNMMEVLSRNFTRSIESVRAFELGNTFHNIKEPTDCQRNRKICVLPATERMRTFSH